MNRGISGLVCPFSGKDLIVEQLIILLGFVNLPCIEIDLG